MPTPNSNKGRGGLPYIHSAVALMAAEAGALDQPLLPPAGLAPASPRANGAATSDEEAGSRADGAADGTAIGGGGSGGVGEQGSGGAGGVSEQGGQAARVLANLVNSGIGSSTGGWGGAEGPGQARQSLTRRRLCGCRPLCKPPSAGPRRLNRAVAMPMVTKTLGVGLAAGVLLGQAALVRQGAGPLPDSRRAALRGRAQPGAARSIHAAGPPACLLPFPSLQGVLANHILSR